ncbi:MAG: M23 family metallopeptidase [Bacillota bacterium]|jgi:murein DD-endopeptidase MepM/ murein hydrolase activator NlpD|nr:M23 family metallopeptidase [Bacillota bacterium]
MFWLISRFLEFYRTNKGKKITFMSVPDDHGEVKTLAVPVLGLYFGIAAVIVIAFSTIMVVWNYRDVRNNYATVFDLLQKKNTQYEAVLDTSQEQKKTVESLITETEELKLKLKQLENAFTDINRLLEQTGNRPVQIKPLPERQDTVVASTTTTPVVSQAGIGLPLENRLGLDDKKNLMIFTGVAFAASNVQDIKPPVDQQEVENLLLDLQERLSSIEQTLVQLEKVSVNTKNRLIQLKYEQDHTPDIWPAKAYISSAYGWRAHPIYGDRRKHTGIDIGVLKGTPVKATADGVVSRAGWVSGYGILVQIDHGNGIETLYGHLSRAVVKKGDTVKKGQLIAYSGNTGLSTGDHLHYEVRLNGKDVNPMNYLP